MSIRLNKLLARRGLGARRKCDVLIQSGAVRVNGQVVTEPGTMVEPERDQVEVRGKPLPPAAEHRYFVLHKPIGVISTLHDPEGRRTIRDLLPPGPRLFPVGRLDADTSGLLVLTNDGELAHRLMHPRYGVTKSYRVRVAQVPDAGQLHRLGTGVEFEPGVVSAPARVWVVDTTPDRAMLSLIIHEGRYRQVRRMCEAVGLTVLGLHRSAYGPLHLGELTRGMWRELSAAEVASLRAAAARPAHHAPQGGRYLGVPRGAGVARRAGSGPRPRGPGRPPVGLVHPVHPVRPVRPIRASGGRPGERTSRPRPARAAGVRERRAPRPVRPADVRERGIGRPPRPLDYRKRGAVRPSRPMVSSRRGAARPGRVRRPVDIRQGGPGRFARPAERRRSGPTRPVGRSPRGPVRPAESRRREPARPVGRRRQGSARPAESRRSGPARPVGRRRQGSARPAESRQRGSAGPGRAGKMARSAGRGGAKTRSRRPPEGRGKRRSR